MLSIVIPAYNEMSNIPYVLTELCETLERIEEVTSFEILVVDDHSSDQTYDAVLALKLPHINCIRLSRRSGSHMAIRAGLQLVKGDAVLLLAADGQDNPDTLIEMLIKWREGADMIWALREKRSEPFLNKLFALAFYQVLSLLLESHDKPIDFSRMGFFLLDRKVIDAVNACPERNTSLPGLMAWVGYRQEWVEYSPRSRRSGKSKWRFRNRLRIAKDWIIAFSGLPLKLMTLVGFAIAILGFIYAIITIFRAWHGFPIQGWASLMVILLVIGGLQMLMMGIMGEYLWRNLDETRNRPLYFIEKTSL